MVSTEDFESSNPSSILGFAWAPHTNFTLVFVFSVQIRKKNHRTADVSLPFSILRSSPPQLSSVRTYHIVMTHADRTKRGASRGVD